MNRVSDETGSMEVSLVAEGSLSKSMLESKDGKKNFFRNFVHHVSISILTCTMSVNVSNQFYFVVFIVDSGKEVFVWVGNGASADEKKNAMTYAHVRFTRARYLLACIF